MIKTLERRTLAKTIKQCRARNPKACRYHGAYIRLDDALAQNDVTAAFDARQAIAALEETGITEEKLAKAQRYASNASYGWFATSNAADTAKAETILRNIIHDNPASVITYDSTVDLPNGGKAWLNLTTSIARDLDKVDSPGFTQNPYAEEFDKLDRDMNNPNFGTEPTLTYGYDTGSWGPHHHETNPDLSPEDQNRANLQRYATGTSYRHPIITRTPAGAARIEQCLKDFTDSDASRVKINHILTTADGNKVYIGLGTLIAKTPKDEALGQKLQDALNADSDARDELNQTVIGTRYKSPDDNDYKA